MLPVIGIILAVVGIVLLVTDFNMTAWALGLVSVMFAVVFCLCWIIFYFDSVACIADLEAFQQANRQAYLVTVEQTEEAVIRLQREPYLQISVENLKQSTNWSERIKELRDRTIWYNKKLRRLRVFNENWWLYLMFANPSKELVPLILEK